MKTKPEALMRYRIEPMSMKDYDDVLRLWQGTAGIGLSESDTRRGIATYLKRNPGMSFVARHQSALVGAVLCGHDGRRGYLHHLAVAKPYRKMGIGSKLVTACLAKLKRLRILKCNIFLFSDNSNGARFWKRNGWVFRKDLHLAQKVMIAARLRHRC